MRVAITGSSGLIGTALREALVARGDEVVRVVRRSSPRAESEEVIWNPTAGAVDTAGLEGMDLVVHLAGESLMGVWTPGKKREIRESREAGTRTLARALASLERKPAVLLSSSAMGYYGDRPPAVEITEEAGPGDGFLPEVAVAWEAATQPAEAAGIRVVHMRQGNVLSPKGGMLPVLTPVFRLGLGATFGSGAQMWPWIALDDVIGAMLHVYEHGELSGPVNFTAPSPVSNAEFSRALAAAVGRWALFSIPAFAARAAPGGMADEMLLSGARVVPKRLLESGYTFRWPELRPALEAMLQR